MSAPSAAVDICNLALDYLGQQPISSIEVPESQTEEIMARWYDHTRQICLREYVWNFATKYQVIPRTGAGSAYFVDAYSKPNDFIRLLGIGERRDLPTYLDYEITEGTIMVTNGGDNGLSIWYTKDVTNVASFDPLFVNIFALRLALKVSYKFTLKKGMVDLLNGMLKVEEAKATSVDGQERPPRRVQESKYHRARRGIGYGQAASRYYEFE